MYLCIDLQTSDTMTGEWTQYEICQQPDMTGLCVNLKIFIFIGHTIKSNLIEIFLQTRMPTVAKKCKQIYFTSKQ